MADDNVVKGSPSKAFFINMITRDIALGDAILDLLDNAVDGIKRTAGHGPAPADYASFFADVKFSRDVFKISDNCGGIPLEIAKEYAFRFGKPEDVITAPHSIGLYGIGMKRALFKMGQVIDVSTSTGATSYTVEINVEDWRLQAEDNWDFPLRNVQEGGTTEPIGTRITVTQLHDWIATEFETPVFHNTLIRSIQRDYAFILDRGFRIKVNGVVVDGRMPTLRVGSDIAPVKLEYHDDGVHVEIVAGLSAPPPEDDSPQNRYPEQDLYGWYVVCNERVVVTADKTHLTGWGVDPVPAWHPQFFGFLGLVRFEANDAKLLPWRTTKRDVDSSSPVFNRALVKMREISKEFTEYTNRRKSELSRAREAENASKPVAVSKLSPSARLTLPKVRDVKMRRICFDKPTAEIDAVGRALGMKVKSVKQVGIAAFDYVRDREVES